MRFEKVYLEITNVCDLSCPFCPRHSRPPAFMDESSFARALEALKGKTGLLYFHLMGEPLLHPLLADFLRLAGEEGFRVRLTTNGGLLPSRAALLLSSPALRQVNVSLHSRAGREELEAYLDGVAGFLRKAEAAGGPVVGLRLWNYGSEASGAEEELREAVGRRFGVDIPARADEVNFRGIRLGEGAYLNLARAFAWPSLAGPELGEAGFCRGLRDQIGVLADGTVVPCCLDAQGDAGLGNLFRDSLDDILAGQKARAIYRGFSERRAVEALCRRCGYRARFDLPPA